MTVTVLGLIDWSRTRDDEGHKTYKGTWKVETTDPDDGPQTIASAAGLPAIGAYWNYGNDSEAWAFRYPNETIKPLKRSNEKNYHWTVDLTFGTRPLQRCQTTSIENPLLEPVKMGGSFVRYTREATHDRNGDPILSSSHEMLRGSAVEFDENRPTVWIEKNFSANQLTTFGPLIDHLNDATLWGVDPRCVKFSNVTWEKKWYGACTAYWTARYFFDINFETFDRSVLDEGTKILRPGGDKTNPQDFVLAKDKHGQNKRVILDGNGNEWDGNSYSSSSAGSGPGSVDIEKYEEANLLLLGIPSSLT